MIRFNPDGPGLLEQHTGRMTSRAGGFIPGERVVFKGRDLHHDLHDLDWMELYVYGFTGRRFTPAQVKVLHALWTYTSYPDARLWNNRIAALAGGARSTGALGLAAALAASEAQIYGRGVDMRAIEFLIRAAAQTTESGDLTLLIRGEIQKQRGIAGYGRPLVSVDERIPPMLKLLKEQGLDNGLHIKTAFEVERVLLAGRWRLHMNYGCLAAAVAADLGFSPREYYFFGFSSFLAGMVPCYEGAVGKPEGLTFPLPCRIIAGATKKSRRWKNPE